MKTKNILILSAILLPELLTAQTNGTAGNIQSLQGVLDQLYTDMIPMCSELIGVGRGIAGFAALCYIAYRVWRHLANAEPIDFFPLFRPFAIGLCILLFPSVIGLINGILQPTVSGSAAMVSNSDAAVAALLQQKQDAVQQSSAWQMYVGASGEGDQDKWYQYLHPGQDPGSQGIFDGIGNDVRFAMAKASYNFRNSIKEWMSEVLQVLFQAASLCINTLRTFNLIILAILGPLVFGLSVFDGFHFTLRHWLARYINVFLWLPVANIFGAVIGKIQENMLKIDLAQIGQTGDSFFSSTDIGYLIFMVIGIIGYFTVPSIAGYIMHVGGGEALSGKTTAIAMGAAGAAAAGTGMITGAGLERMGQGADNLYYGPANVQAGYQEGSSGTGIAAGAGRAYGQAGNYLKNKLSGDQNIS